MHKFPSGGNIGSLEAMQNKAQCWVDKRKNRKLKIRSLWFLIDKQFWPKVNYGLCGNTESFIYLEHCLQKQYWQIMTIVGIICLAPKAIRQVDRGFQCAGCSNLGVKNMVEQLNKLLMHYGCKQVGDSRCSCICNSSLWKWEFQVSRCKSPTRDMVIGSRQDGSKVYERNLIRLVSQWKCATYLYSNQETATDKR